MDDKNLKDKLTELISKHNKFVNENEGTWLSNEALYKGDHYKRYSRSYKGLIDVKKDVKWRYRIQANHTFSFIRALHSMLVSNSPSVTVFPCSRNDNDKAAAIAADSILRYERKRSDLDSYISQLILQTLIYGTGIMKIYWDPQDGDYFIDKILNPENGEYEEVVIYDGNVKFYTLECNNFIFDNSVSNWKDCRWFLEKKCLSKDVAWEMYPTFKDSLVPESVKTVKDSELKDTATEEVVYVYEYWEKRDPLNKMKGKYVLFTQNGTVIKESDHPYEHGKLPYVIFTDIDIPNKILGKSIVELLENPQKTVNKIMSQIIENIETHGVIRVAVSDAAGISEDSITDKPYDIIKFNGTVGAPPIQLQPASLPPHMFQTYDMLVNVMEHLAGLRAYSRGEMQKAVSGFAAQLLIEQDQKTHIQLHKKYLRAVEKTYKQILSLVNQFWKEKRNLTVLGDEQEYEYYQYAGADVNGDYDIAIEYGTALPPDPVAKRQSILDLYREGIIEDKNEVLRMLELGDILGVFDVAKDARKRQQEEIEIMKKNSQNFGIREYEDHQAHLEVLYGYFQSKEFELLDENLKEIIELHAREHEDKMKSLQAPPVSKVGVPPMSSGNVPQTGG